MLGEEREKAPENGAVASLPKTAYILSIPGGALMGIIPAVILARIAELAESETTELFHAFDGASTGQIILTGLNIPADDGSGR